MVAGPDGSVWFVESVFNPDNTISTSVDWITHDGQISTVASLPGSIAIFDLTNGPDGNVWYAGSRALPQNLYSGGVVGRIGPSGEVTQLVVPNAGYADHITSGGNGSLRFTAYSSGRGPAFVGRVTLGGQITEYTLPNPDRFGFFNGATADRHGNLWVAASGSDPSSGNPIETIDRVTPSGQVTEYVLPQVRVPASRGAKPRHEPLNVLGMTTGTDGNVWFTEGEYDTTVARGVERVTPSGRFTRFTVFPPGVNGLPDQITSSGGHRLFFSVVDTNWDVPQPQFKLGEVTTSGHVSIIRFPTKIDPQSGYKLGVDPYGRVISEPHGNLWFLDDNPDSGLATIDRLTLPGQHRGSR
jgi:streptogramin lyase